MFATALSTFILAAFIFSKHYKLVVKLYLRCTVAPLQQSGPLPPPRDKSRTSTSARS